ncbi:HGxxPAAW family protein [Dermacoccaceae bacterium W4C1]
MAGAGQHTPDPNTEIYHGSTDDHGASVAAWFGVLVLIIASAVIALGIFINADIVTIIGVALAVGGLIVAIGLAKAGHGVAAKRRKLTEERAAEREAKRLEASE